MSASASASGYAGDAERVASGADSEESQPGAVQRQADVSQAQRQEQAPSGNTSDAWIQKYSCANEKGCRSRRTLQRRLSHGDLEAKRERQSVVLRHSHLQPEGITMERQPEPYARVASPAKMWPQPT